eukprot:EG_transcript_39009
MYHTLPLGNYACWVIVFCVPFLLTGSFRDLSRRSVHAYMPGCGRWVCTIFGPAGWFQLTRTQVHFTTMFCKHHNVCWIVACATCRHACGTLQPRAPWRTCPPTWLAPSR